MPFRLQGRWWESSLVQSHTSESILDYFPELCRVEPLAGMWVWPAEPRVWVCPKPGGVSISSPMMGKCQSSSHGSVGKAATQSQSLTPSEPAYAAVSTAGVKKQAGANQIPEDGVSEISTGRVSRYPKGWDNCFSPG